ncbi:MAG TPA: biopolymer transporter ExbD [Candidatus Xenobia bacterium]|nr:biopolymer transporter ExbD [Candidatus Xenobia bacterium]
MAGLKATPHTSSTLAEINIVPLVDVVLVLLIIFMITAPVLQSGIEVELPKTRTVKAITEERLVLTIDRSQRLYLGNELMNINSLGDTLRERTPRGQTSVFIRCDESVPFGTFATVMDTVRQSGIENISVVTEPIK